MFIRFKMLDEKGKKKLGNLVCFQVQFQSITLSQTHQFKLKKKKKENNIGGELRRINN